MNGRLGAFSSGARGQTTTEYLMIVGLLTAIIISLTKIIVPPVAERSSGSCGT